MRFDAQGWHDGSGESTSSLGFAYSVSQGYGIVYLQNGTIAFIDVLTGRAHNTEFVGAQSFSEGLASVAVRNIPAPHPYSSEMLWGYINTDFEITISPEFIWPSPFSNGKAITQLPNLSQVVIDTQGEVLFAIAEEYSLGSIGELFFLHGRFEDASNTVILSSDFEVIPLSEKLQSFHGIFPEYLGNGWYTINGWSAISGDENVVLMNENEEYYFPDVRRISFTDGDFIIYSKLLTVGRASFFSDGVMTMDGKEIISSQSGIRVAPVIQNDKTIAFIANTGFDLHFPRLDYAPNIYTLYDTGGNIIIQGSGILTYHEAFELYSIQNANHFSWLDKNANLTIAIPLLSSTID
jgi:hypothetical protein